MLDFILLTTLIGTCASYAGYTVINTFNPDKKSKQKKIEQQKENTTPSDRFAYDILNQYQTSMIRLANRTSHLRKSRTICLLEGNEVSYRDFDKTLNQLIEVFEKDTDMSIYNHVALTHRHFFSIFVDSITKVPADDDFFTTGSSQQEHEQILAMAHDYHQTILASIAVYQTNRRQATLNTIKEAYTYENTDADLNDVDQSALPAPTRMTTGSDYSPEDELALAVRFPHMSDGIKKSFTVIYNGTRIDIPEGTTFDETRQAVSQVYPEVRYADMQFNPSNRTITFTIKASDEQYKIPHHTFVVHFNDKVLTLPGHMNPDQILYHTMQAFDDSEHLEHAQMYTVGNNIYYK